MRDRFEDLRTFGAVVQTKHFGSAAEQLGLAKFAVSRRVRELEDRLGVRLLNRSTRRLSLTDAGAEFYERSLRILSDLEEAESLASKGAVESTGTLRVSGPMSFGILHLAPVIGEFMSLHPNLTVELDLNDRVVDLIDERFDMAVRISWLKNSNLIARTIAPIRFAAVGAPVYFERHGVPSRPDDLAYHRGLAYTNKDDRLYWQFRDPCDGTIISPIVPSALRVNNGDALREAAIAGYGVAILPTFIVHKAVARKELQVILHEFEHEPLSMYAVFSSRRNLPAKNACLSIFWSQGSVMRLTGIVMCSTRSYERC